MDAFGVEWGSFDVDPEVARRVRAELDKLAGADGEEAAIDAAAALHELVCYAAVTVEEETVPAARALRGMLGLPDFRWKQFALQLLDTIISVAGVLDSASPLKARVRAEVLRSVPLAEQEQNSSSRDVRGAAIVFLGSASETPAADFQRFRSAFERESDPVIQADLALAATACAWAADGTAEDAKAAGWFEEVLGHSNPAVRFRVGQFLVGRGFRWSGGDLVGLVAAAVPAVLERRLFRQEYL
ncbi:hypothetical protein ABZ848_19455 [Streptomyces sp. NPDC047081]|uniref:hypothetical protein n=1 Tax=Streptomyces sp. NPDC047081 TaxID=3154706 RepID=UPI0033CCFD01